MADFQFLQNPISKKWVILAPRRSKRPHAAEASRGEPDVAKGAEPICPFCIGREKDEQEVYRVGGQTGDSNWLVRVLPNKFPFAPIHEVIIHSPDHHKNFGELPLHQVELIIKTYRQRYLTHQDKGQVYIFHNRGEAGGESLPHPHTQLAVVPSNVVMDIPMLDPSSSLGVGPGNEEQIQALTPHLYLFCPKTSQWPDEVWIVPKERGRTFGDAKDGELADLSYAVARLVQIFDLRHGHEFPFNFYIYPGLDWYLRLMPRVKSLGGFEIGTGVFVNTQDPQETIQFIKDHFEKPDEEKIRSEYQAEYGRTV
ncbi:MAG: hypothetical protein HYS68_01205 [Candidatus Levybacteria bacterium]|nr:hypothetical protein [Candidatus Levybacteria bacterium]